MTATGVPDPGGDYTAGLGELQHLLLGYQGAEDFLQRVAAVTARTVGGGLSCMIMLQAGERQLTVATSDTLATAIYDVQYTLGQGPCLRCLRWQHPVHIDDLAEDARWPVFALRAAEKGVRSCLSLPLEVPQMTGALSLYAPAVRAFGPGEALRAKTFAGYVSGAITLASRQDGFLATIGELRGVLASRPVVDQAVGIVMARQHCTSRQALAMLRSAARDRRVRLHDLASQIVSETSGAAVGPSGRADPAA